MVDLSGSVIAERYQIARMIASGGMATVYLAKDLRLDRPVALKIVHSHLSSDQDFREKFIQEAKISAKLSHSNLVNVYDQGQDGDKIFLAMEYVPGITLREGLKTMGALNAEQALELYEQLLAGLAAAHQAGILHRDLKPENVLLADDGRIKLADFGLARKIADQTQAANLIGTVAYLSPELVTQGTVDARSDVYAAGVMLYELVTGQQPFQGEQAVQVAMQHATSAVPAPSSIKKDVPEEIDELVLWATEREPDDRPADAAEFLQAVKQARKQIKVSNRNATAGFDRNATQVLGQAAQTSPNSAATTVMPQSFPTDFQPAAVAPVSPDATQILSLSDTNSANQSAGDATQIINRQEFFNEPAPAAIVGSNSRFKPALALLVAMLTILLGLGAGWAFGSGPFAPYQIPALAGLSQEQAMKALQNCHCDISTSSEYSASIPSGLVISSSPIAGAMIWGSEVKITVSKGAKLVAAPKLSGLNVAEATAAVLKSGFKLGKISSWFNQAPIGTVYEYQGSNGEKVAEGSTLDLKISLGSLPVLSNIDEALATTALEAAGLKVAQVTIAPSETVAVGKVINFVPLTDPIGAGGEVELIVSGGPSYLSAN